MDHIWPSDLDADARCERCGLSYNSWSTDELNCVLPARKEPAPPRWDVDKSMQTIVLVTFDRGAEWEETEAYGPFADEAEASSFAVQAERSQQADPDCTVTAWLSTIRQVHAIEEVNK